jgi:hypothetical protein
MEEQTTQAQKTETQAIPNRRARRYRLKQQGVLKYLSKRNFLDPIRANFRAENMKNGINIQSIRKEAIDKQLEADFMVKLESMKETWYEIGYNSKEIELLEEAAAIHFAKDKSTWKDDKKEAKELRKKAKDSLASRKQ